ncbi:MAG: hypothetical protein L0Y58_18495 [Verrucomicrobia subdivision 3 bacterium]|nr:hypothetical protein [Limisphaerales bacterium]
MKVINTNKLHQSQSSRPRAWMHHRIETWLACATALALLASTSPARADRDDDDDGKRSLRGQQNEKTRERDAREIAKRGDITTLPGPLKDRIVEMAGRPHTYVPQTVFSEVAGTGKNADVPSQLFQYYLLDTTGFESNVFTSVIPGINDTAIPTAANAANGGRPTVGSVRVVLEPKPGLPTDPNDPGAFVDIFTDISGLFVINNESGWYEGWMDRDIPVPPVAEPHPDGRARYGTMTSADADALAAMGSGNNIPGNLFTFDGNAVRRFPAQGNTVSFPISTGSFNALQQSDVHAYWEFNPGTSWVFPHYELPFTGGLPGTFAAGLQYSVLSLIPGSGPFGVSNDKLVYGDDPENPRDPDRTEAENPERTEKRNRFIPSGLTEEIFLNAFCRVRSFQAAVTDVGQRLLNSYAIEVARVDTNGDGVISFSEVPINGTSDGGQPNKRLFLPATAFNRFFVTREIDDGLLAPRFAPSRRAWVLAGDVTFVNPSVTASVPIDADLR